jgi:histidinol dehydrogenase
MKITNLNNNTALSVKRFLKRKQGDVVSVEASVRKIIDQVRNDGDRALVGLTKKFDKADIARKIRVTDKEIQDAVKSVPADFISSLKRIRNNIARYHKEQLRCDWRKSFGNGVELGEKFVPINRVGFYVPGGMAPLVSTVLMTVVPAEVAGVKEKIVCTPPGRDGKVNPYILTACRLTGVDAVYRLGGAQAIAAMALGTRSIQPVDKIAGPGNIYVNTAKKILYGEVGIDMPAGPSEVLIIADGSAGPAQVAVDLLSQVEHGTGDEIAVLLTTSGRLAQKVRQELQKQASGYYPSSVERKKLLGRIECLLCSEKKQLVEAANIIGAEHVEVMVKGPEKIVDRLTNAGAIFIGPYSPVPIGDFAAGPSHVLPTGGASRAFSGLSVVDFIKRISIIKCDRAGLKRIGRDAVKLARVEGLEAHAQAIEMRTRK